MLNANVDMSSTSMFLASVEVNNLMVDFRLLSAPVTIPRDTTRESDLTGEDITWGGRRIICGEM